VIVKGERTVLGVNLGHTVETSGEFATRFFQNYFGSTCCLTSFTFWNYCRLWLIPHMRILWN